jgi:DNA-binding transcriptional LysR family regulator
MEMHQVRYFLAVARTLNFTRAAEECNVAQPSLTRAIKLLEGELGGDLFRRERPQAMLTPLGERIYPLLKQCYESAMSARSLATMINDGEAGVLKIAVSSSVELGLIMTFVTELKKHLSDLELKIMRGPGDRITEFMKSGDAELAIGSSIGDAWDRLDRWALFEEGFDLVFSRGHRLASNESRAQPGPTPRSFVRSGSDGSARSQHRHRLHSPQRADARFPGSGIDRRPGFAAEGLSLRRRRAAAHARSGYVHEDAACRQLAGKIRIRPARTGDRRSPSGDDNPDRQSVP